MVEPTNPAEAEKMLKAGLASSKGKMGHCTLKMNLLKECMNTEDTALFQYGTNLSRTLNHSNRPYMNSMKCISLCMI